MWPEDLWAFFFFLFSACHFLGCNSVVTASKDNWQKKPQGMRYESYDRDKATYKAAHFLLPLFSLGCYYKNLEFFYLSPAFLFIHPNF